MTRKILRYAMTPNTNETLLTISDESISKDEMKTLLTAILEPISKNSPIMSLGVKLDLVSDTTVATSSTENDIVDDTTSQPSPVRAIRFLRCHFVDDSFEDFQELINQSQVVNVEFDLTNVTLRQTTTIMSATITSKHNIDIWFNRLYTDVNTSVAITRLIDFTNYLQVYWKQWYTKILIPASTEAEAKDGPEKNVIADYLEILESINMYQMHIYYFYLSYLKLKDQQSHPRVDLVLFAFENDAREIIVEIRALKSKLGHLPEDCRNTFKQTLDDLEKDLQLFLPSQLQPTLFLHDRIAYYSVLCQYLLHRYKILHHLQYKEFSHEPLDALTFNEVIIEYGAIYTTLMGSVHNEGDVDHRYYHNTSVARQTIHACLYALFRGFIGNYIAQPNVDDKLPVSPIALQHVLCFHQAKREIDFIDSLERIHFAKLSLSALYDIGYAIILIIESIYRSASDHDLATSKRLVTAAFTALGKIISYNSTSITSKLLLNWTLNTYFNYPDSDQANDSKIKIFIGAKILKFLNAHRIEPSPLQKQSTSIDGYYARQRFAIENLVRVSNLRMTRRQMPAVADKLEHQKALFEKITHHLPDPAMLDENYLKNLVRPPNSVGCYYLDAFTPMTRFCLSTIPTHCFAVINILQEVFDYLITWVSEERHRHVRILVDKETKLHEDAMKTWCNYLQACHAALIVAMKTLKAQLEETITEEATEALQGERRALLDKAVAGLNKPAVVTTSATSATSSTATVIQSLPKVVAKPKSPITRIEYQPSHVKLLGILAEHYGAENVKIHGSYITAQVLLQMYGHPAPYNDLDVFVLSKNTAEDGVKLKSILTEFNANTKSSSSNELEIFNGIYAGALIDIAFVGPDRATTPAAFIDKASTDYKLMYADIDGTLHDETKQALPALKSKQQRLHNLTSPICMLHHAIGETMYGFTSTKKDLAYIGENVASLKMVSTADLHIGTLKLFYQKKAEKSWKILTERGYMAVLMPELLTNDKATRNQYIAFCKTLDSTYHNYRAESVTDILIELYYIAINKSWHNTAKGVPVLRPIILSTITRSKGLLLASLTEEAKCHICTEISKKFGITEALEPIEARLKVNGANTSITYCEFIPQTLDASRPKGL